MLQTSNMFEGKTNSIKHLSEDKLDVTSSRSKFLKKVVVDEVTIEEKNVVGSNNFTVVKCINLSNDKLSNDKLAENLLDSDSFVGADDCSGIATNESVGKVVVGKFNYSRGLDTSVKNDKLDNNLNISDGKFFEGDGKLFGGSSTFKDKLDNNLNISLVNRKLEDNDELEETELETNFGLSINNNNIPNSRLILINNVKPLASTLSSSPCLKPLHVSNSTFHLNHSDHGNIITKHCKSRKRKEFEDKIHNQIIKSNLKAKETKHLLKEKKTTILPTRHFAFQILRECSFQVLLSKDLF